VAYLRGSAYIWFDGERFHLWAQDGLDHWRDTEFGKHPEASGVALSQEILDQFVCMRFAQLVTSGKLQAVVRDALEQGQGNFGCKALLELGSALVDRLTGL